MTRQKINRFTNLIGAFVLLVATIILPIMNADNASATQIQDRSLVLIAGDANNGGSEVGATVKHEFNFVVPSVGDAFIGSIRFQYCLEAVGSTCTMPANMVTNAGVTIESQLGATGFTLVNPTNGDFYISRTAASVAADTELTYRFSGIVNSDSVLTVPTIPTQTFFVRITTYNDADLGGSIVDSGVVAASTAEQIDLSGQMPESLVFCVGATVSAPVDNVPDCSTATDGHITFNQLFSPSDTAFATSQMAASTNASSGYNITVNGTTLMNGSIPILAMGTADVSKINTSQFGMNLVDNDEGVGGTYTPNVGSAISLASNDDNFRAQALTGYAVPGTFKYASGDSVANSGYQTLGGSDAQIMTVSYIANVPGSQPAGTYATTLTYICTPTF